MLIRFFKHGTKESKNTTSKSVKDYLLNERTKDGTARIIRGDELLTSKTIDQSEYSSTYTSGCLSFDKEEYLDDEQKQELMASFEEALLPNFDPTRYACYWVEHTDKNRLELNFVFARIDLATGKNLNIYYHRRDEKRLNNWKEIQIQKYDLKDPNDPIYEQERKPLYTKRANGSMIGDCLEGIKNTLHNIIKRNIEAGEITNREGVIQTIQSIVQDIYDPRFPAFEIVKETKTSLTIKHIEKNETFRLKGSFYARDFVMDSIQATNPKDQTQTLVMSDRQKRHNEYVANKDSRLANAVEWYERLREIRSKELIKKYPLPKSEKPSQSLAVSILNPSQNQVVGNELTAQPPILPTPTPKQQPQQQAQSSQQESKREENNEPQPTTTDTNIAGEDGRVIASSSSNNAINPAEQSKSRPRPKGLFTECCELIETIRTKRAEQDEYGQRGIFGALHAIVRDYLSRLDERFTAIYDRRRATIRELKIGSGQRDIYFATAMGASRAVDRTKQLINATKRSLEIIGLSGSDRQIDESRAELQYSQSEPTNLRKRVKEHLEREKQNHRSSSGTNNPADSNSNEAEHENTEPNGLYQEFRGELEAVQGLRERFTEVRKAINDLNAITKTLCTTLDREIQAHSEPKHQHDQQQVELEQQKAEQEEQKPKNAPPPPSSPSPF